MKQDYTTRFISSLKKYDVNGISQIPKGDLHCHCPLSFNKQEIEKLNIEIPPELPYKLSFKEFEKFITRFYTPILKNKFIFEFLCKKCVDRAIEDGVKLVAMSLSLAHRKKYNTHDDFLLFVESLKSYRTSEIEVKIDIGLRSEYGANHYAHFIDYFIESGVYDGIDIWGIEKERDLDGFSRLYSRAGKHGMRLKAHLGESMRSTNLIETVIKLNLAEIHHGIAFSQSDELIQFLIDQKIRLHICPVSNIRLGYIDNMTSHPISKLIKTGVRVTLGTDDVTLFENSLSKDYADCYRFTTLTLDEMEIMRLESLKH